MSVSDCRFIQNFIYLIGGFTQKTGADTGMMRLWAMLFRWRAATPGCAFTFLMPREWNDSVKEMAAMLRRHAVEGPGSRVIIIGYSWGAGHGAPRLARALRREGVEVDLMILIDPIYRSRLPMVFRLLAFTTWLGVKVPANVRRVMVWRQRRDRLCGTRIRLEDCRRTRVTAEIDLTTAGVNHTSIQYHPPLLRRCFHEIRTMVEAATNVRSLPTFQEDYDDRHVPERSSIRAKAAGARR